MTALTDRRSRDGSLVVGGILIVVGFVALAMTYAGLDPSTWLGGSGWTLFVITPGVILLLAGLVARGQAGEGLTIGGSIVTTIGLMLLVMDRTGAWETWAYAWALIPAAAGVGVVLHGIRTGNGGLIGIGLRLVAISAGLFLLGAWYFGNLFETGVAPIELGDAWPVVLIGAGAVVIAAAFIRRAEPGSPSSL
jgi:hypothetical protein